MFLLRYGITQPGHLDNRLLHKYFKIYLKHNGLLGRNAMYFGRHMFCAVEISMFKIFKILKLSCL